MTPLEEYYNKFNEDKRLLSRHGRVEFNTTMHFIRQCIRELEKTKGANEPIRLADIGAGTGRYSIALAREGVDVTAVELVNYNLGILKKNAREMLDDTCRLNAFKGNALKLKRFEDESFDVVLLLGPLYHLHSEDDKVRALTEAKRILVKGGIILAGYVMADYALIKHGFMEENIENSIEKGMIGEDYSIESNESELYDYVRLSDINVINRRAGLKRRVIFSPDGAADYIRPVLNAMPEERFNLFMDYQLKNAARSELVGAGSHTVDILVKE